MTTSRICKILVSTVLVSCAAIGCAQAALVISSNATKNVACSAGVCTATAKFAVMNAGDLTSMLASSDVTLVSGSEAKDIESKVAFSWASAHRLTLDAYRSIAFDKLVTVAGTGALTLTTNDGGAGGTLSFAPAGRVVFWDLSSSLVINGSSYALVGDIATLAADIASNPSGRYALANNYDATPDGTYTTSPIGLLYGTFEGLGNKIFKLTIIIAHKNQSVNLGFFSGLGTNSVVENLSLTSVKIVNGAERWNGILTPVNGGLIARVHVGGRVVTGFASITGGLVGSNSGTILSSDSVGFVQSKNASMLGGLVGIQWSGQISGSHSTADVSELTVPGSGFLDQTYIGGLVGRLRGSLDQSWASGTVQVGSRNGSAPFVGGLVGYLDPYVDAPGSVSRCYATGAVTGGDGTFVGGLVGVKNGPLEDSYSTGAVVGGAGGGVGGLLGADEGQANADDYWDLDTSGVSDPSQGAGSPANDPGITGLTDAQLKSGLPAGFDPAIWAQSPAINGGYPYLIANPPQH
jgi:hypothetical protein